MRFAVVQKEYESPTLDQLKQAFQHVRGHTPFDAERLCKDVFGTLVRNFDSDQAHALQAGLASQGIPTEIVEESRMPVLPPAMTIRQLEFHPDGLMLPDPLMQRKLLLKWSSIILFAAGAMQQAAFTRARKEWEEVRVSHISIGLIPIPIKVRETKVEYSSQETAQRLMRAEIFVLDNRLGRYSIEAEKFDFSCLGGRETKDFLTDFCTLLRDFVQHAPNTGLNRGANSICNKTDGFVMYPARNVFEGETLWLLWKAGLNANAPNQK